MLLCDIIAILLPYYCIKTRIYLKFATFLKRLYSQCCNVPVNKVIPLGKVVEVLVTYTHIFLTEHSFKNF